MSELLQLSWQHGNTSLTKEERTLWQIKPSTAKRQKLVVLQLTGANDYLNTVVPYTNPLYYDNRPNMHIPAEQVQPIDDTLGFNPNMQAVKRLMRGRWPLSTALATPTRIIRTFAPWTSGTPASPEKVSSEGWLGKVVRDLDPKGDNVLTAVNSDAACRARCR